MREHVHCTFYILMSMLSDVVRNVHDERTICLDGTWKIGLLTTHCDGVGHHM